MSLTRIDGVTLRIRGLALITVLWLISLLTLLATAALAISRSHDRMAARAEQMIAADLIADSAIRVALLQINAPLNGVGTIRSGFSTARQLRLFDRNIELRIEREAGRVDLNTADAQLLAAVFRAGGIDKEQSAIFAARIVDWRDGDDRTESGGAELAEYQAENLDYGPRNAPFESVGELREVLGLADLSGEILDAFTVYSTRSPTIAPEFAQPLVRNALNLRRGESGQTASDGSSTPTFATSDQTMLGQAVRVHACVDGQMKRCRVAIARLTGSEKKPFLIYSWYTDVEQQ